MDIILLGAPGSGKGTQGALLAEHLRIPKISTGDLLRAAAREGTPLGVQAQSYMNRGLLVPDEIVLDLIGEVLRSDAARTGLVMDGFPRTLPQAEAVDGLLASERRKVDHVVEIAVPESELADRMLKRAAAEGRGDDTPETIRKRFTVYREQTAPLIAYYERQGVLRTVDGTGSIDEIADRVKETVAA